MSKKDIQELGVVSILRYYIQIWEHKGWKKSSGFIVYKIVSVFDKRLLQWLWTPKPILKILSAKWKRALTIYKKMQLFILIVSFSLLCGRTRTTREVQLVLRCRILYPLLLKKCNKHNVTRFLFSQRRPETVTASKWLVNLE